MKTLNKSACWISLAAALLAGQAQASSTGAQLEFQAQSLARSALAIQARLSCAPSDKEGLSTTPSKGSKLEMEERKLDESARCWIRVSQKPLENGAREKTADFIKALRVEDPSTDPQLIKVALKQLSHPVAKTGMGAMMGLIQISAHQTKALQVGKANSAREGAVLALQLVEKAKEGMAAEAKLAREADKEALGQGLSAHYQQDLLALHEKAFRWLWRSQHFEQVFEAQKKTGSAEGEKLWSELNEQSRLWAEKEAMRMSS